MSVVIGKESYIPTRFVDIVQQKGESKEADLPYLNFVKDGQPEQMSFREFHKLINYASHIFFNELGDVAFNKSDYLTVGYLSQSSHYCLINHFGLMDLNLTPVILSPNNSIDILVHLLKQSQSKALIYGKEMESVALQCQNQIPNLKLVQKFEFPQDSVTSREKYQPFLQIKEENVKNHIVIVLHSSGTTSLPKLIKVSNQYITTFLKRNRLSSGCDLAYGNQLLLSPLFHIFGLATSWSFLSNSAPIVFPSSSTLHSKQIIQAIEQYKPSLVVLLPYLIKQLVEYCEQNKSSWSTLKKVNALFFAGAGLPSDIGILLRQNQVGLMTGYGSTETGFNAFSDPTRDNLNLHLMLDIHYELINRENSTCQIKILTSDPGMATDITDSDGFVISDRIQIIHHNNNSNQLEFQVLGRMDDTIIHISGEKTNPIPMEETILACPLVKSAVILGSGKLNTCLLIQLNEAEASNYSIMKITQTVHKCVERANSLCPSHSRIDLDLVYILPLNPDKPLPATAKGNVNRKKTKLEFDSEIESLYSRTTMSSLIV